MVLDIIMVENIDCPGAVPNVKLLARLEPFWVAGESRTIRDRHPFHKLSVSIDEIAGQAMDKMDNYQQKHEYEY